MACLRLAFNIKKTPGQDHYSRARTSGEGNPRQRFGILWKRAKLGNMLICCFLGGAETHKCRWKLIILSKNHLQNSWKSEKVKMKILDNQIDMTELSEVSHR